MKWRRSVTTARPQARVTPARAAQVAATALALPVAMTVLLTTSPRGAGTGQAAFAAAVRKAAPARALAGSAAPDKAAAAAGRLLTEGQARTVTAHQAHLAHERHLARLARARRLAALARRAAVAEALASTVPPASHHAPFTAPRGAVRRAALRVPAGGYAVRSSFQACVIRAESGGNPGIWNASGHWGLYQFSYGTWVAHGGAPSLFGHAGGGYQTQVFWSTVRADGGSDWSPYDGCAY